MDSANRTDMHLTTCDPRYRSSGWSMTPTGSRGHHYSMQQMTNINMATNTVQQNLLNQQMMASNNLQNTHLFAPAGIVTLIPQPLFPIQVIQENEVFHTTHQDYRHHQYNQFGGFLPSQFEATLPAGLLTLVPNISLHAANQYHSPPMGPQYNFELNRHSNRHRNRLRSDRKFVYGRTGRRNERNNQSLELKNSSSGIDHSKDLNRLSRTSVKSLLEPTTKDYVPTSEEIRKFIERLSTCELLKIPLYVAHTVFHGKLSFPGKGNSNVSEQFKGENPEWQRFKYEMTVLNEFFPARDTMEESERAELLDFIYSYERLIRSYTSDKVDCSQPPEDYTDLKQHPVGIQDVNNFIPERISEKGLSSLGHQRIPSFSGNSVFDIQCGESNDEDDWEPLDKAIQLVLHEWREK